jgi:hypothetical protein
MLEDPDGSGLFASDHDPAQILGDLAKGVGSSDHGYIMFGEMESRP